MHPEKGWNRRHCTAALAGMALVGLSIGAGAQDRTMTSPTSTPASARAAAGATLLVLGDSLSAEYGLPRGSGWVTLLGQRLDQTHPGWQVVNASISGETTSGGRARLPALLGKHHPRLVIIELGGNDALRGLSLQQTREHLQAMVQASLGAGAKVLLLGMQMPPNYGADHAARFAALYREVAKQFKVGLVPFFLSAIADKPDITEWFQADRIHPTVKSQALMLDTAWPELKKLL
ncbi:MAG: arylesterase [Limnohabitans sp.]